MSSVSRIALYALLMSCFIAGAAVVYADSMGDSTSYQSETFYDRLHPPKGDDDTTELLDPQASVEPAAPKAREKAEPPPKRRELSDILEQMESDPAREIAGNDESPYTTLTLPAGMALPIILHNPLSTAVNRTGDPVEAVVSQDVYLGNRLVLKKKVDRLSGRLVQSMTPIQGRDGILTILFDTLIFEDGQRQPIVAYVVTGRGDHSWGGMTTRGTEPMRVTHRVVGIGAYNKTVYGGPRAMGEHIEFLPGEPWTVVLQQPAQITTMTEPTVYRPAY
ncbi:MAG: hypothetical protein KTR14_11225 [Vampirovibrio sp.]|nr:hypothetical protein [Vampirovibrio sp.]